jgi:hypothetical protein
MTDVLETLQKLPKVVAITKSRAAELAMDGPYLIHRGIPGYDPRPGWTDHHCAVVNEGVTENQIEAMQVGSMFGWHVPGADPDTYQ